MREIRHHRLVEKRHLLKSRHLKDRDPSRECISFYRWILPASALQPLKKHIHRLSQIVQLDSSAKGAGSKPQRIPLGSCPGTPFNDDGESLRKQVLSKLPLQRLNLLANIFAMPVYGKSIQPLVRRKANRSEPAFKRPRKCGLP
ncbi:MAG: hypothetical protein QOK38_2018 [Acidobacteriaceae bacterium]|nr:hypothetical protein [Acidobacteriaceae bacterium]